MKVAVLKCLIGVAVLGILLIPRGYAEINDVVLIVHRQVPDTVVSDDDLKDIFLGKKSKWSDGAAITFVIHQDNDVHTAFLKKYIGRTVAQFSNHWKREVFTGKGRMPRTLADDQQMLDFVMNTQGAIGYVSPNARTDKVKVVTIK